MALKFVSNWALSFKNDKEDGKWIDYNKDGSVIKEITFKDGKLWNGIWYSCYSEKFSKPEEYVLKDGEFLWEELNSMNIWGSLGIYPCFGMYLGNIGEKGQILKKL